MKKNKKILLGLLILSGILGSNLAYAGIHTGPIVPCGTKEDPEDCTLCHLWELASNIINFISFNLAIPVAVLLFVSAGILYIISGGDQTKMDLAKKIFFNTVIGLVIIFCSWLLVDTFFKSLAKTGFSGAWNDFPVCSPYEQPGLEE